MRLEFDSGDLARLYTDPAYRPKRYDQGLIKAYRKKVGLIAAAGSEQELRQFKSLHLEKLLGTRREQWSVRLNDQWRLILRFRADPGGRTAVAIEIVDYH